MANNDRLPGHSRRTFIRNSAYAAAAAGVTSFAGLPRAHAAWGDLPPGTWAGGAQPYRIVEIILYGGCSTWENFWVRQTPEIAFAEYGPEVASAQWTCGGAPSPADEVLGFEYDELGNEVYWGPSTKPLWNGDLLSRTRMVTQRCDPAIGNAPPHELALMEAFTGLRPGNPRAAGLGAAIEHRMQSLSPRGLPYAYVLSPATTGGLSYVPTYATQPGTHGHTPFHIRIGATSLKDQLPRDHVQPSEAAMLRWYRRVYRDLLRFKGQGDPTRSPGFSRYETAAQALEVAPSLDALLTQELLAVETGESCVADTGLEGPNSTATALRVAAHLMENADARYVCILDRGIVPAQGGGGGYDCHAGGAVTRTSANIWNLVSTLASLIDTSSPGGLVFEQGWGGVPQAKFTIDDTLFLIRTEFSRTTQAQGDGGRDHHAAGFPAVLMGGPVASRGICGALDDGYDVVTGDLNTAYRPRDVLSAAMVAAHLDPFTADGFLPTDLSSALRKGSADHDQILQNLRYDILGVNS